MPLIKGKSEKSFGKNVESEMHAGKPQDQALAIAYSVKRKAKKMAKGGMIPKEDHAREMDKSVFDEAQEHNESLHPGHGVGKQTQNIGPEHLGMKAQEHEELEEPKEPSYHEYASKEDMPAQMLAHGSLVLNPHHIAKAVMAKKMAQGGQLSKDMDYLAENDSYPDIDDQEFDMLDPHPKMMADGGEISKDTADAFKKGMSGVLAEGGEVDMEEDDMHEKKKHALRHVFSKMGR